MNNLIVTTNDEKEQIRKSYNVTETKIKADIKLLQEWTSKQPHLPQNLTDDFIERILLRNKFRIEQAKQKLENYFTIRGNNLELITNLEKVQPSKEMTTFIPMPKLTSNLERITIMNVINSDTDQFTLMGLVKTNLAIGELALRHDYAIGDRFVVDFAGYTAGHLMKVNPTLLNREVTLFQQAYACRVVGVDMINFPSFAIQLKALIKLVLKPKIFDKIHIHEDLSSLHKVVPKENLPLEYGGTQGSIKDILVKWDEVMKEKHDFFVKNYKNVSNETLRVGETKNNADFGVQGTFRTLSLD